MARQQYTYSNSGSNPFRAILGLIVVVAIFYVLFKIVGFAIQLLWYLVPVLFIATLIVDHKVVVNYGKWIGQQFKTDATRGIVVSVLSIFFCFLVVPYLFAKAMFKRKVRKMKTEVEERQKGKYADYEEVAEEEVKLDLKDEGEIITLDVPRPQPKQQQRPKQKNSYDELFDDI